MSVQILSGASSDLLTIDSTSKAARVTLYSSNGLEIKYPQNLQTYQAVTSAAVGPGTSPTDVFAITGSASAVVKIYRMWISTLQTTASINNWFLLRRSTANSGGTSAAPTLVANDPADPGATATVLQYTAAPTLGSLVGAVWCGRVASPAAATGVGGPLVQQVDFIAGLGRPMTLRGVSQVLAWNFAGASLPAGMTFLAGVTWTEE